MARVMGNRSVADILNPIDRQIILRETRVTAASNSREETRYYLSLDMIESGSVNRSDKLTNLTYTIYTFQRSIE